MDFYYLASRGWMESEILSGKAIRNRIRVLRIDLEELGLDLAERAEKIRDETEFVAVGDKRRICVLDSGIDPELKFGSSEDELTPFDAPIIGDIGWLPELPEPTDSPSAVIEAWEGWIEAYTAAAQNVIDQFNADPPTAGSDGIFPESWADGIGVDLGYGLLVRITPDDGTEAIQAARAARMWNRITARRFSKESIEAAREAIGLSSGEARQLMRVSATGDIARFSLDRAKKRFATAKAYDIARAAAMPDFETEMRRWATEHGSQRLQLGLEDGYRMNGRYLAERIAREAPGMYAMPVDSAGKGWATKASSPSESALLLRRRIAAAMKRNAPPSSSSVHPETEIVTVKKPPHEIYRADPGLQTESGTVGADLPSREGWPWGLDFNEDPVGGDPIPFEAVVVKNWLGRFHLIGAVNDTFHGSPPGIWAVPDLEDFGADGVVVPADPDAAMPERAKRKPPEAGGVEGDDIPF